MFSPFTSLLLNCGGKVTRPTDGVPVELVQSWVSLTCSFLTFGRSHSVLVFAPARAVLRSSAPDAQLILAHRDQVVSFGREGQVPYRVRVAFERGDFFQRVRI